MRATEVTHPAPNSDVRYSLKRTFRPCPPSRQASADLEHFSEDLPRRARPGFGSGQAVSDRAGLTNYNPAYTGVAVAIGFNPMRERAADRTIEALVGKPATAKQISAPARSALRPSPRASFRSTGTKPGRPPIGLDLLPGISIALDRWKLGAAKSGRWILGDYGHAQRSDPIDGGHNLLAWLQEALGSADRRAHPCTT